MFQTWLWGNDWGNLSFGREVDPTDGREPIPVLDLFAGAGGLSIGLHAAGLDPVGAVEIMEDAAKTYEAHHDVEVDRRRLEKIPERELRAMRGKVSVVAGGPPCQPWSTGGLRRGDEDDRDGFTGMFRALDLIRPEAFIIENVAGLERGKTRPYFLGLLHVLELRATDGTRAKVDVVFTRARVAVFVDGCFWHGCPEHGRVPSTNPQYWPAKFARNRARDERVTAALEADGWTVMRLWEHVPVVEAAERVKAAVAAGSGAQSASTHRD